MREFTRIYKRKAKSNGTCHYEEGKFQYRNQTEEKMEGSIQKQNLSNRNRMQNAPKGAKINRRTAPTGGLKLQEGKRHRLRMMTLNVYSVRNKKAAKSQYLYDNQVHVAAITETHIQEDKKGELHIEGYIPISSCCRQKGSQKGGVVILVHITVPGETEYSMVACNTNELERCAATIYPNHTKEDMLQIAGIYRPPKREHPPYQEALRKYSRKRKQHTSPQY